jgi:glycerol uptake facilitator protein
MPTGILPRWFVGEFFGTFLLVFFGCGSVAAAVFTGAQVGIFQVAIVWGLGIATAIYLTGSLSGAHLNPAVTLSLATWAGFPWRRVTSYITSQLLGAFAASAVLYVIFSGALTAFETSHGITRGAVGSEASAMVFAEYFPNPGGHALTPASRELVTPFTAFLVEALGTGILVLVILSVTNHRNASRPKELTAATIGLTVTLLISLLGPLTMACFNPARDLAPRIFSTLVGRGKLPFTVNGSGWFTVYVLAPIAGGIGGGLVYRLFFKPHYSELE